MPTKNTPFLVVAHLNQGGFGNHSQAIWSLISHRVGTHLFQSLQTLEICTQGSESFLGSCSYKNCLISIVNLFFSFINSQSLVWILFLFMFTLFYFRRPVKSDWNHAKKKSKMCAFKFIDCSLGFLCFITVSFTLR